MINEDSREVFLLEVGCTFDSNLEAAFVTKQLKYQPLVQAISQLGYKCQLIVLIFGSLGHVHRLVVRGLRMIGILLCICYYWQSLYLEEKVLHVPIARDKCRRYWYCKPI